LLRQFTQARPATSTSSRSSPLLRQAPSSATISREIGFRLLVRYGRYIGLTEGRIKVGQYLFQRHGGKIVFFGRFVALLRVLAALLAGVNRMSWPRFFFFNAAGAILWATVFGLGAYTLGEEIEHLTRPVAVALVVAGVAAIATWVLFLHSRREELEAEALRALPGPLATRTIKRAKREPARRPRVMRS
jgi:hypothetical protein